MLDSFQSSQGEQDARPLGGGLGIGLTVGKKLVELHGGSISAESQGLGMRREFTIRLLAA